MELWVTAASLHTENRVGLLTHTKIFLGCFFDCKSLRFRAHPMETAEYDDTVAGIVTPQRDIKG